MGSQNAAATNSVKRREAILDQAIATFAHEGFRNADVQAIADKAGVGKGTVYRYFGNKEDLFWASTFGVLARLERRLVRAIEGVDGALARLRAVGRAYAEFFDANPQYLEIFVQERAEFRGSAPESHIEYHKSLIDRFAGVVEAGIAAGEIRPVDVRKTIVAFGGVLYGAVVHACYASFDQTLTEMAQHAMDVFLEGIKADAPTSQRGI